MKHQREDNSDNKSPPTPEANNLTEIAAHQTLEAQVIDRSGGSLGKKNAQLEDFFPMVTGLNLQGQNPDSWSLEKLKSLVKFPNITTIDLSGINLHQFTEEQIKALRDGLPRAESLKLTNCKAVQWGVNEIATLNEAFPTSINWNDIFKNMTHEHCEMLIANGLIERLLSNNTAIESSFYESQWESYYDIYHRKFDEPMLMSIVILKLCKTKDKLDATLIKNNPQIFLLAKYLLQNLQKRETGSEAEKNLKKFNELDQDTTTTIWEKLLENEDSTRDTICSATCYVEDLLTVSDGSEFIVVEDREVKWSQFRADATKHQSQHVFEPLFEIALENLITNSAEDTIPWLRPPPEDTFSLYHTDAFNLRLMQWLVRRGALNETINEKLIETVTKNQRLMGGQQYLNKRHMGNHKALLADYHQHEAMKIFPHDYTMLGMAITYRNFGLIEHLTKITNKSHFVDGYTPHGFENIVYFFRNKDMHNTAKDLLQKYAEILNNADDKAMQQLCLPAPSGLDTGSYFDEQVTACLSMFSCMTAYEIAQSKECLQKYIRNILDNVENGIYKDHSKTTAYRHDSFPPAGAHTYNQTDLQDDILTCLKCLIPTLNKIIKPFHDNFVKNFAIPLLDAFPNEQIRKQLCELFPNYRAVLSQSTQPASLTPGTGNQQCTLFNPEPTTDRTNPKRRSEEKEEKEEKEGEPQRKKTCM